MAGLSAISVVELSELSVETIKSSVPVLKKRGTNIAIQFYKTLFERYPHFKKQFNTDRQKGGVTQEGGLPAQVVGLTNSIIAFARNVDKLDRVVRGIEGVCHKHISRGVSAKQYDAIAECFLSAMVHVLGVDATEEIMSAWTEGFALLASLYIESENKIRGELEEKAGYSGFVSMAVLDIEDDEEGNRNISLKPEEYPVPPHLPGQFLTFSITKKDGEKTMTSMKIKDDGTDSIWIFVPLSKEKASQYLLHDVKIGGVLNASIPCGKGSKRSESEDDE